MKTQKLNQVIGLATGLKSRKEKSVTKLYHLVQKPQLFLGRTRRYEAFEDGRENELPAEDQAIQFKTRKVLEEAREPWEKLINVVAAQDLANCQARAEVVVGETTVLEGVPVTTLIFLEKQLNDLATFVDNLPVLDPAENWTWDDQAACYVSEVKETQRTQKVLQTKIVSEATEHHPAQYEKWSADVPVGVWKTRLLSGAIEETDRQAMLERIRRLRDAIVFAREEANGIEAPDTKTGSRLMDFVLGKEN